MWFHNGPELAFRDHRDCGEDDRTVASTLETEHLARVALAERDLAALSYDLDLDAISSGSRLLHAIMLSCHHAARKDIEILRRYCLTVPGSSSTPTGTSTRTTML